MIQNSCIVSLDDSNFDSNIQNENKFTLIDFWAEWCAPCKMFAPILEEIAVEYHEKINFGKLNVDGNPLTVKKYNIRSIPTLLLFKNSIVVDTKIGTLSKKQVKDILDSNLVDFI